MQKIVPFLWFHSWAEEAINFYLSVFPQGKILSKNYFPEWHPYGRTGEFMSGELELAGQRFGVINGGDYYTITPWVSFVVNCENQQEVDYYWEKLGDGAKNMVCGWLTDKYWVTWQIIPREVMEIFSHPKKGNIQKFNEVMMEMQKLDIEILKKAFYN